MDPSDEKLSQKQLLTKFEEEQTHPWMDQDHLFELSCTVDSPKIRSYMLIERSLPVEEFILAVFAKKFINTDSWAIAIKPGQFSYKKQP